METLSSIEEEISLLRHDIDRLTQLNHKLKYHTDLLNLGIELKSAKFFLDQIQSGKILLVGEGNLSFARCLIEKHRIYPHNMSATTYESETELSEQAKTNAAFLEKSGAFVLHNVDAGHLHRVFTGEKFASIIFQFPNIGSRKPVRGRNPNFNLVRGFLNSARNCLYNSGKVIITAVDSPHYAGAFQFEEAAEKTDFHPPKSYAFDPKDFSGYSHTNTNDDESALETHKKFLTWIFHSKV